MKLKVNYLILAGFIKSKIVTEGGGKRTKQSHNPNSHHKIAALRCTSLAMTEPKRFLPISRFQISLKIVYYEVS